MKWFTNAVQKTLTFDQIVAPLDGIRSNLNNLIARNNDVVVFNEMVIQAATENIEKRKAENTRSEKVLQNIDNLLGVE